MQAVAEVDGQFNTIGWNMLGDVLSIPKLCESYFSIFFRSIVYTMYNLQSRAYGTHSLGNEYVHSVFCRRHAGRESQEGHRRSLNLRSALIDSSCSLM